MASTVATEVQPAHDTEASGLTPKISVLMMVRDEAEFLRQSVMSLANQTTRDLEIIIGVDAASDEETEVEALWLASRCGVSISVFRAEPTQSWEYYRILNDCFDRCRGEFIARQDGDDWSDPARLEKEVRVLEEGCDLVSCEMFVYRDGVTERRPPVGGMDLKRYVNLEVKRTPAPSATIVCRRHVWETLGGFDPSCSHCADDDWSIRATLAGFKWGHIEEPLYYYRKHPGSMMVRHGGEIQDLRRKVVERYL